MAGRMCRPCRDLVRRQTGLLYDLDASSPSITTFQRAAVAEAARLIPSRRQFHQTVAGRNKAGTGIIEGIGSILPSKTAMPYQIFGATQTIYKACSTPATYVISEADRKNDIIIKGEDGEEIGVGGGIWFEELGLKPTFSSWSQVTMLHMYLFVVRLRCLEKDAWQAWQTQLVNAFFNDAEERMDLVHGMSSRMIRSKYLTDLFETWRGVMLAYDQGLIQGDAVLASAVWRNIYKASEDVDMRHIAAIVSWMRSVLRKLDNMLDPALLYHGSSAFDWQPSTELKLVDAPASLDAVLKELARQAAQNAPNTGMRTFS